MTGVVSVLLVFFAVLFGWAFFALPREQWQILAVVPREKEKDGSWRGINLTYYGFFTALGVGIAVAVALFLLGSAGVPFAYGVACLVGVLAVCIPASRIVNRLVEGQWHGFTIGGASFVGMILGPWIAWGFALLLHPESSREIAMLFLGALAVAYAIGEGVGRLACISFGCCYGRPLRECPGWLQRLFQRCAFVFRGPLKKASYASGWEGERLVPIQGVTAVVSGVAGLVAMVLFLCGHPQWACMVGVAGTQGWRFLSEFLRADYRGAGRITAYQGMALAGAAYVFLLCFLLPVDAFELPDIGAGLASVWSPGAILLIESTAMLVFLRMGISTVTGARLMFDLRLERVSHCHADMEQVKE